MPGHVSARQRGGAASGGRCGGTRLPPRPAANGKFGKPRGGGRNLSHRGARARGPPGPGRAARISARAARAFDNSLRSAGRGGRVGGSGARPHCSPAARGNCRIHHGMRARGYRRPPPDSCAAAGPPDSLPGRPSSGARPESGESLSRFVRVVTGVGRVRFEFWGF